MRNILVPHTGQVPWAAVFPFFIVICCAFFISRFALHLTQYASATPGASLSSRWTSTGPRPALILYQRYGFGAAIWSGFLEAVRSEAARTRATVVRAASDLTASRNPLQMAAPNPYRW